MSSSSSSARIHPLLGIGLSHIWAELRHNLAPSTRYQRAFQVSGKVPGHCSSGPAGFRYCRWVCQFMASPREPFFSVDCRFLGRVISPLQFANLESYLDHLVSLRTTDGITIIFSPNAAANFITLCGISRNWNEN